MHPLHRFPARRCRSGSHTRPRQADGGRLPAVHSCARGKHLCKEEPPPQQPAGSRSSSSRDCFHFPFYRRDAAVASAQGSKPLVCAIPAVLFVLMHVLGTGSTATNPDKSDSQLLNNTPLSHVDSLPSLRALLRNNTVSTRLQRSGCSPTDFVQPTSTLFQLSVLIHLVALRARLLLGRIRCSCCGWLRCPPPTLSAQCGDILCPGYKPHTLLWLLSRSGNTKGWAEEIPFRSLWKCCQGHESIPRQTPFSLSTAHTRSKLPAGLLLLLAHTLVPASNRNCFYFVHEPHSQVTAFKPAETAGCLPKAKFKGVLLPNITSAAQRGSRLQFLYICPSPLIHAFMFFTVLSNVGKFKYNVHVLGNPTETSQRQQEFLCLRWEKPKVMLFCSLPWPFPLVENQSPQAFVFIFVF